MNFRTTMHMGAAVLTALALTACGQSRHSNDVVAEDIFAPAVGTEDQAIETVQTVFDDPFAPEAQLITDAGARGGQQTNLTNATVPVSPVVSDPIFQEAVPQILQQQPQQAYGQQQIIQQPSFNCGLTPTSKSELMLFRQYCGGIAPQGNFGGGGQAPSIFGGGAPAQQAFVSPNFDCGMNPSSKAELAYFRANCLANIGAPISAPQSAQVAVEPQQQFVEEFVDNAAAAAPAAPAPAAAPQSYDCNILPTSRAELELYQQFCG